MRIGTAKSRCRSNAVLLAIRFIRAKKRPMFLIWHVHASY
ncbi:Uncharacterised protein [Vibrio cholerae]|nr:Uncharacterised protein [Vibrio cholerae]